MARNKTAQGGISLRRKVTAWLAAILLVTMLSTGIATMAGQWTVRSFDMLLADNAVCYTVQNALKDETQAVSYTHLDVYKRQVPSFAAFARHWPLPSGLALSTRYSVSGWRRVQSSTCLLYTSLLPLSKASYFRFPSCLNLGYRCG